MVRRMTEAPTPLRELVALELAPAAACNFAVSYAAARLLERSGAHAAAAPVAVAAGILAFALAWFVLRAAGKRQGWVLPAFEAALPPPEEECAAGTDAPEQQEDLSELAELLLTDRVEPAEEEELLLTEALPEADPASRVVRLFARQSLPSPGELQERVDRHLGGADRTASIPDATAELHEALRALRGSLGP
jgi:hypothetical protein